MIDKTVKIESIESKMLCHVPATKIFILKRARGLIAGKRHIQPVANPAAAGKGHIQQVANMIVK